MLQFHETGKLIRALRKQKDMTQDELAGYANIDTATLSKIENGHAMPQQGTFRRLLEVLKFDYGDAKYLFMTKEEMEHEEIMKEGGRQLKLMQMNKPGDVHDLNEFLDKIAQNEDFLKVPRNMQGYLQLRSAVICRLAAAEHASYNKVGLSIEEYSKRPAPRDCLK